MKLYNGRYILPALAAFLALATLPVWRGAAARSSGFQSPPNPQGQRCIEAKSVMRAGHMRLLIRWRDEVVREDRRLYIATDGRAWEKSLVKTCLGCHGAADAQGKSTTAATACNECHEYVKATLDCWNCHIGPEGHVSTLPPERRAPALREPASATAQSWSSALRPDAGRVKTVARNTTAHASAPREEPP